AFRLLNLKPHLAAGAKMDPRLRTVTVRQLLQHTGGWDRGVSYDPMFIHSRIAEAMGLPSPVRAEAIVRYMMGQPLDFDPGTRYAYSNFGYCVLGRLIEQITGQTYEEYVRARVLRPMGITRMRIGKTRLKDQFPDEAHYYDGGERTGRSLLAED